MPTPPAGVRYRRLFGETLLPVCSPGLLRRGPPLLEPRDLARHTLLCSLHRPLDWPTWLAAAGINEIDGNSGLKFENSALAYPATIDELGVVVAQRAFVDEDLRTGRLVAPLALRVPTEGAYYLAYPADRPRPPRVEAFEDWLMSESLKIEEAAPPTTNAGERSSTSLPADVNG